VAAREAIDVRTGTTIGGVRRHDGGFSLEVTGKDGSHSVDADAVVLASGFDHVDARAKGPYGYGMLPQVTTGEEMERAITERGQGVYDDMGLERVAFVQCVGSRDEHAGRGYCSQVCCRYAVRLARLLKRRIPQAKVTIYKMDIQSAGRDMTVPWRQARAEGVRLVAGLPAIIRRSQSEPHRAEMLVDDVLGDEICREAYDLIVLSTGIMPRVDAEAVADQFGIDRNVDGFYRTDADGVTTGQPGLFVAGCCGAPRSMSETAAHARQTAEACFRYLMEASA